MSTQVLRCAALTRGPYPLLWEIRALAALWRSGLATPVAIFAAGDGFPGSAFERLCRRHAERRANSLAPMVGGEQTLGLPVLSIRDWQTDAAGRAKLDFLIDFRGAGAPPPTTPRLGCWILRLGAGATSSLQQSAVAAFCETSPAIDVALVSRDAGGAERTLHTGRLRRRAGFAETLDAILLNVTDWYELACRKLLAGQAPPAAPTRPPAASTGPAAFAAAWLRGKARAFRERHTIDIWNIGIAPRPSPEALASGGRIDRVTWLPGAPDLTFRADPFGWLDAAGDMRIAHERFDYRTGKGTLEVARLKGTPPAASFEVLADLPVHTSYPFLVPVPGMLLCLPEVNETGRTLLFRIETEPLRFIHVATLLDDVPLSDGTIFRFGGHHWLFGTRADRDSQLRLYAWFARAVDGPWTAHALNPIKCDITSARPAGMPFRVGESLIRPAQDCSRSYGCAITLNRILELTPTSFREETIGRIEPDPDGPYPDGIHTLSFVGGSVLIDGKRRVFRWNAAKLNETFIRRRQERRMRLHRNAGPGAAR